MTLEELEKLRGKLREERQKLDKKTERYHAVGRNWKELNLRELQQEQNKLIRQIHLITDEIEKRKSTSHRKQIRK